jgi:membrane-anchored protein YejM (alkaline phosphatase superfamily)
MSETQFNVRNDENRFDDPSYEQQLLENITIKVTTINKENKARIETLFAYINNPENSDMRGRARIFWLEWLYIDGVKHSI